MSKETIIDCAFGANTSSSFPHDQITKESMKKAIDIMKKNSKYPTRQFTVKTIASQQAQILNEKFISSIEHNI